MAAAVCSNTTMSPWTAMALIAVSVLASHLLQIVLSYKRKKINESDRDGNQQQLQQQQLQLQRRKSYGQNQSQSLPEQHFFRYAWMRRRQDRLSFDHIDVSLDWSERDQNSSHNNNSSHSQRRTTVTSLQLQQPQTMQQRKNNSMYFNSGNKRLSLPAGRQQGAANEPDTEFLPKNFNWSHFERPHDDEHEMQDTVTSQQQSPRQQQQQQPPPQLPAPIEARIISGSELDEEPAFVKEQFVWTDPPVRSSLAKHAGEHSAHKRQSEMTKTTTTNTATELTTPLPMNTSATAENNNMEPSENSVSSRSGRLSQQQHLLDGSQPTDPTRSPVGDGNNHHQADERHRRLSLQISSPDRDASVAATTNTMDTKPMTSIRKDNNNSSSSPRPEQLRRKTFSYPELVPMRKLRRFFTLESCDDGDTIEGLGDEDENDDDDDDNEEINNNNDDDKFEGEEEPLEEQEDDEVLFRTMNREARARYNSRIMPSKVVLIRHGQSMGNIDEFLYATTPDNAMPLTKLGWEQARYTGRVLKEQVLAASDNGNEAIHFIVSPYVRTVETFHGIVSAWCDPAEFSHIENRDDRLTAWYEALVAKGLTWHEDPRIREQDFGNYQDPETIKRAKQERHRFGVFYYRFPHGESASDVFDRVSTFLDSLWRSFDFNKSRNYVLITHGISIRVFLARYFRYTIDQFSMLHNPRNCEMVILGHDGAGKLNLERRCDLEMKEDEETHEWNVVGHKFHRRLRVIPQKSIRKVKIRISYDDN